MDAPLLQLSQYLNLLLAYWWPFCRIMAMLSLAPLFSQRAIMVRVRVALAVALTVAMGAAIPDLPILDPFSMQGVAAVFEQIAVGLMLGLALQLVFTIYTLVAGIISTPMGLSMAMVNDPVHGVSSSSILYQLYYILLVLLFFAVDGHLVVMSVLYLSFIYWPIGSGLYYDGFSTVLYAFGWVFSAAVLISTPIVFCMFLVQFCFGLLNRISPSMNLFSLGFPMAIVMGLTLIYLTLPNLGESYLNLTQQLLDSIGIMMRESGNG
ncbi:flagellar biosynthetic protein FliR [Alkalilimnicola ehrlichii]|uniref:Flagellar biosynthetic protein FliR n=1 Tax=Alkalilimnicola ehrlichii TaxID=351052 RepID=A0A3E0WZM4_9GAMM|nr:flagellar biosynthetic protein FliR [Alkalilimnicola ehrlichii]RFA30728.1 flagellar biosynthetic protein FliR [Alkalilimnicola ehrlichii]RFA38304.1 flagellar biosynthetic protein FliR [Alkalilimnicola ehrlichii]